jgi:hypothetical protein
MIQLNRNTLNISFPEVHEEATCEINFNKTLRDPNYSKDSALPLYLGTPSLRTRMDYFSKVPRDYRNSMPYDWFKKQACLFPMQECEAMWMDFSVSKYPYLLKITVDNINAVTGEPDTGKLNFENQNFVSTEQNWLDGYSADGYSLDGKCLKQFAAPLSEPKLNPNGILGVYIKVSEIKIDIYPLKVSAWEKFFDELRKELGIKKSSENLEKKIENEDHKDFRYNNLSTAPTGVFWHRGIDERRIINPKFFLEEHEWDLENKETINIVLIHDLF